MFAKLADLGAMTLLIALPKIFDGSLKAVPQDEDAVTYAMKISKEESHINFNKSAEVVDRTIRGLNPWPVATTELNGIKYKVFMSCVEYGTTELEPGRIVNVDKDGINVACAQGIVKLITIQAPGKGPVKAADLARSRKDEFCVGKQFG